ncbi:MAG: peptide-binding protein [Bacillota bacterium]
MMSFKRLAMGALVSVLSASVILAGCSSGTKAPTETPKTGETQTQKPEGPVVGGTMIYTTIGDAAVLLPTLTADTASSFVTGLVFDSLVTYDDKLNPYPALAEKWEVKDDKIYTFTLKKGVKFHDGKELTAEDVVFTYTYMAHPKYQGVRFGDFTAVKGWGELGKKYSAINKDLKDKKIDEKKADELKFAAYDEFLKAGGITAPDPYTFRVELTTPFAPAFVRLGGYGILPKHLLEKDVNNMKASALAKAPVGTGSMKFVEWVKDDHITLERNTEWTNRSVTGKGPLNIERMIVKVIPDQQANMVALETGETDLATITPEMFDHFKNNVKHVQLYEYMTFSYTYMGYNLQSPMFSDKRVRQAITHAINRQEIVDKILLGHGTLANSHASPVRWDYNPDVPVFEFNADKAAKLLDEAGWKVGADGIREKDGQKMKFEIATNNGNKLREQSAVIIQQALKKVGIEVTINLMEWNAFLDYVDGDKKQAYILGWSLGFDPDAHSIFHSEGGFNSMHGYSNPVVDELIQKGRVTTDLNERKKIYGEMQKIMAEEQVYTWLYFGNTIAGLNTRIKGAKNGSPNGLMWNFEEWWISDAKAQ